VSQAEGYCRNNPKIENSLFPCKNRVCPKVYTSKPGTTYKPRSGNDVAIGHCSQKIYLLWIRKAKFTAGGSADRGYLSAEFGRQRTMKQCQAVCQPATLPPENCVIDVAVYDDEKQRLTPVPDQLQMKTNTLTSILMCFLGTVAAFVFPLWRRVRHSQKPLLTWSDLFEIVAKGFFAVLLALVLTKTDFIGITIDKTSANGFFTTGFLLGFLPLDTIFDRILRNLGVSPPSDDVPQNAQPTSS
jgi:hypothetical protein